MPHGGPHGDGTGNGRKRVERRPGLDVHRQPVRVDERQDPLEQLAVDALLDQSTVVVHRGNGSDTEICLTDTMSHVQAGPPPAFGQLAMRHRLTLVVAGAGWGKSAMLRGLAATAPSIEVRRPASGWTPFALAHALVDGIAEHTGTATRR